MTYYARPNESSIADMEKASLRNLQILQRHIQKQISLQQEIHKNYQKELQSLQTTKQSLISLIEQSLQAQASNDPQKQKDLQEKQLNLANKSELKINLVLTPQNINSKSPNKASLQNRSQLIQNKQKPKQKQVNYLTNINQYKHKDLVQEVKSLLKQLNSIITKTTPKQMGNSSLLMQSKYQNTSLTMVNNLNDTQTQQQQFLQKHIFEMGQLQKLPTSTPSQSIDQVLCSLMQNLQKQQLKLIQNTWKYQQLQIKKMVKQNLQQKTIQNMRLIYKENKRLQSIANVKQVKSNKDIIKFGYTDKMITLIQDRTGFKIRLS